MTAAMSCMETLSGMASIVSIPAVYCTRYIYTHFSTPRLNWKTLAFPSNSAVPLKLSHQSQGIERINGHDGTVALKRHAVVVVVVDFHRDAHNEQQPRVTLTAFIPSKARRTGRVLTGANL